MVYPTSLSKNVFCNLNTGTWNARSVDRQRHRGDGKCCGESLSCVVGISARYVHAGMNTESFLEREPLRRSLGISCINTGNTSSLLNTSWKRVILFACLSTTYSFMSVSHRLIDSSVVFVSFDLPRFAILRV